MQSTVRQWLWHVGMPQCGSTLFQRRVFSHTRFGFRLLPKDRETPHEVSVANALPGRFCAERCRQHYEALLGETGAPETITPVISSEALTGGNMLLNTNGWHIELFARRIRDALPESSVLLIFRNQESLIQSRYNKYVERGGNLSLNHFIYRNTDAGDRTWINNRKTPGLGDRLNVELLKYDQLYDMYAQIFGENRVLFFPLELIRWDVTQAIERLNAFMGSEITPNAFGDDNVNPHGQHQLTGIVRAHNKLLSAYSPSMMTLLAGERMVASSRYHRSVSAIGDGVVRRSGALKALVEYERNKQKRFIHTKLDGLYESSNRRLSQLIGFDLGELGYSV